MTPLTHTQVKAMREAGLEEWLEQHVSYRIEDWGLGVMRSPGTSDHWYLFASGKLIRESLSRQARFPTALAALEYATSDAGRDAIEKARVK